MVIISKYIAFLYHNIDFVSANSAYPDDMSHYAAFYLGLHFALKYLVSGFQSI